jgi:hypothetical protein
MGCRVAQNRDPVSLSQFTLPSLFEASRQIKSTVVILGLTLICWQVAKHTHTGREGGREVIEESQQRVGTPITPPSEKLESWRRKAISQLSSIMF